MLLLPNSTDGTATRARLRGPAMEWVADCTALHALTKWWADALRWLQDMYVAKLGLKNSKVGVWTIAGIITMATALAVAAGYAVHRLRMRNVMQNEIRDIMYALIPHPCLT